MSKTATLKFGAKSPKVKSSGQTIKARRSLKKMHPLQDLPESSHVPMPMLGTIQDVKKQIDREVAKHNDPETELKEQQVAQIAAIQSIRNQSPWTKLKFMIRATFLPSRWR